MSVNLLIIQGSFFHSHNFHHMKCVTHYDYKKDFVSMSCTQNAEDKASKVTNKLCKL